MPKIKLKSTELRRIAELISKEMNILELHLKNTKNQPFKTEERKVNTIEQIESDASFLEVILDKIHTVE